MCKKHFTNQGLDLDIKAARNHLPLIAGERFKLIRKGSTIQKQFISSTISRQLAYNNTFVCSV